VDLLDVMNPSGMFLNGKRRRNYSSKDILPSSGRLIPEFDGRQSIRQMFSRGSSILPSQSIETSSNKSCLEISRVTSEKSFCIPKAVSEVTDLVGTDAGSSPLRAEKRAVIEGLSNVPVKRAKSSTVSTAGLTEPRGQQSLKGFFKPSTVFAADTSTSFQPSSQCGQSRDVSKPASPSLAKSTNNRKHSDASLQPTVSESSPQPRLWASFSQSKNSYINPLETSSSGSIELTDDDISALHDPIESKNSWSKLFTKPTAPRCEGHNEPCVNLLTKKSGMNCGRSFWMCPRPLGPTGAKERNTQWRCQTFIWCSDWSSHPARDPTLGIALHGK
jgi:AP endonuclease 2